MQTIYKYKLEVTDEQVIYLPQGSKILSVQVQNGVPCLWAHVQDHNRTRDRVNIWTFGTGHDLSKLPENADYIGTYQLEGGRMVFHVYAQFFTA